MVSTKRYFDMKVALLCLVKEVPGNPLSQE